MSGKITIVSKPPKLERKKRVAAYARVSSGKDAMLHSLSALTFDRIKIDLSAKELRVDNTPVALTKSEYLICEYLARNKGQVFSKEQIYETVFGLEGDSDNSTISTHIKNIRSKLNKLDIQPIETVWGIGYKWE